MNARTQRFLRLALVKAAMDNCNAKADGKCPRYKKDWVDLDYGAENFVKSFESHLKMIAADLAAVPIQANVDVLSGDSREALATLQGDFASLSLRRRT